MNRPIEIMRCLSTIEPACNTTKASIHVLQQEYKLAYKGRYMQRCQWYHSKKNLGCAGGRNFLIDRIKASGLEDDHIIVFLDDDLWVARHSWLFSLAGPIARGLTDICGVEGRYVTGDYHTLPIQGAQTPDYVSGGWMAVAGRVFNTGLRFDERFNPNYWEDVDFCYQARAAGFRLRAAGDIGLVHPSHPVNHDIANASRAKFIEKWRAS